MLSAELFESAGRENNHMMDRAIFTVIVVAATAVIGFMLGANWRTVPSAAPVRQHPSEEFVASFTKLPPVNEWVLRRHVYAPAYAGVRTNPDVLNIRLAATLSIRNTSTTRPLILEAVDYYDTEGAIVQRFMETPSALKPLGAVEFFVETMRRQLAWGLRGRAKR